MFEIVHRCDQRKGSIAAVEFEGEAYGAGVSFFLGNLQPGKGPGLHQHPYAETCIVLSGRAAMVVDGKEVVAGAGDVVIIGPGTPHRFTAIGDERLDMVCVHDSDRFIIQPLGD
ncbi:MAG: cupin domain-containing protein [Acidobacteriota bacterium]|nr:cupin domain-containing protein [Acidobacteriota bacterium]